MCGPSGGGRRTSRSQRIQARQEAQAIRARNRQTRARQRAANKRARGKQVELNQQIKREATADRAYAVQQAGSSMAAGAHLGGPAFIKSKKGGLGAGVVHRLQPKLNRGMAKAAQAGGTPSQAGASPTANKEKRRSLRISDIRRQSSPGLESGGGIGL